jgi:steroid delta-isomerase-like uncharacterized protein
MTRNEIEALLSRCAVAMMARDAAALADEHAEHCVMESPTAGGTVTGRDAVRQVYAAWYKAFPDLSTTPEPPVIDGHRTAQVFMLAGTDSGGFLGLPPTGKPFRLPLVWLCEAEHGSITRARPVYDFSGMLIQLGVLKVKST